MEFLSHRVLKDKDGEYRLKQSNILVRKILNTWDSHKHLKSNKRRETLLKKHPNLKDADIDVCLAWATMMMPERTEYHKNKKISKRARNGKKHLPVKFMFDENLSWKLIYKVLNKISEVSQIHLEDMAGAKDIEIWNKFRTNGSRAIIVTKDDDFIKLSETFAMHAMMSERRMNDLDSYLKDAPFVVYVDSSKKKKRSKEGKFSNTAIAKIFKEKAHHFVKTAMKPNQSCTYMKMTRDGFSTGDSLPRIFQKYLSHDTDIRARYRLDTTNIEEIDLSAIDFEQCINWKKLNKHRMHVDFPYVSAEDYDANSLPNSKAAERDYPLDEERHSQLLPV